MIFIAASTLENGAKPEDIKAIIDAGRNGIKQVSSERNVDGVVFFLSTLVIAG